MKKIKIILSKDAKRVYSELSEKALRNKKAETLVSAIQNKIYYLSKNTHFGQPISKNLIAKYYKKEYGIKTLFRIQLPYYWRMVYSITNDRLYIIAFVIEIIDHKEYNKRFNYKKN